jgi:hypothetical protein
MNYTQAIEELGRAKSREAGKPIGNNTRLMDRGTHVAVRLHQTDVVDLLPDGSVRLRTGGWRTVTTKERINRYLDPLGLQLYSDRGTWKIARFKAAMTSNGWATGTPVPFVEEMVIGPGGELPEAPLGETAAQELAAKRAARAIGK